MTKTDIQPSRATEIPALQQITEETGLFPSQMLPEMIAPGLEGETSAFWLSAHLNGQVAGFAFAGPEEMTDGTWNLLAIAVLPELQKCGVGRALVTAVEDRLRRDGQRLLLIDTSGTAAFDHVHRFYRSLGFTPEARIRDYWAAGDDKVTFSKALDGNSSG